MQAIARFGISHAPVIRQLRVRQHPVGLAINGAMDHTNRKLVRAHRVTLPSRRSRRLGQSNVKKPRSVRYICTACARFCGSSLDVFLISPGDSVESACGRAVQTSRATAQVRRCSALLIRAAGQRKQACNRANVATKLISKRRS